MQFVLIVVVTVSVIVVLAVVRRARRPAPPGRAVPVEVSSAWIQFLRDDLAAAINQLNNRLNAIAGAARVDRASASPELERRLTEIQEQVKEAADITVGLMHRLSSAPTSRPAVLDEVDAAHVRPARILLVENDDANRAVIMKLLKSLGHDVVPVTNGLEAFHQLQQDEIDCIICDLRLPVMSGKALYEQVEEQLPQALSRFVFVTGDYAHPDSRAFLERTGRPVVGKPYEVDALLRAVAGTLRGASRTSR